MPPSRTFSEDERYTVETAGLAIAAYERTIMGYEAPFQQWLRGQHSAMTESQKNGAMVFFGAAQCGTCHNGPGLTDGGFHALGMPDMPGIAELDAGEQNYGLSGADLALGRGGFTGQEGDKHAFKTPQLYNLKDSRFYGHGGTFYTLAEVIQYKVDGVAEKAEAENYLSDDFQTLSLTAQQQHDLLDFLKHGLYDAHMDRYVPNSVLSGNCFPNSDPQSSRGPRLRSGLLSRQRVTTSRSTSRRTAERSSMRCTPWLSPVQPDQLTGASGEGVALLQAASCIADQQHGIPLGPDGLDRHLARARVRIHRQVKCRCILDDRLEAEHIAEGIHAVDVDVVEEDIVAAFRLKLEPDAQVGHHVHVLVTSSMWPAHSSVPDG